MKTDNVVGEDGKVYVELELRTDLIERTEEYGRANNLTFDEAVEQVMDSFIAEVERQKSIGINHDLLIKLLKIQFQHNQTMARLSLAGVEFPQYEINILSVALDSLDVPEEYAVEDCAEHDELVCYNHPKAFCRDWYEFSFEDMVKTGADKECWAYLQAVIARIGRWMAST